MRGWSFAPQAREGKGRVDLPGRGQFYGEEGAVVSNGLEALKEGCGSLKWGFGCGARSTDCGSQRDRSQVIITSWIYPFPARVRRWLSEKPLFQSSSEDLAGSPTLAQASPMTFFLAPKGNFPGRSVCDLRKLR